MARRVHQTDAFVAWFASVRDAEARARVLVRVRRLSLGLTGDWRPVGGGVCELRIDYGPGYRVYFIERGRDEVVLLSGGDKRTQSFDIQAARTLARALREN